MAWGVRTRPFPPKDRCLIRLQPRYREGVLGDKDAAATGTLPSACSMDGITVIGAIWVGVIVGLGAAGIWLSERHRVVGAAFYIAAILAVLVLVLGNAVVIDAGY
jgi:hypothetical protein